AGVELAARYLPGSSGVDVGGDWYDAVQNPDGTVNLVIGDVAGRGVRAAAMMGQLRTGARAYTLEGRSPATILERVNRLAHAAGFRDMATALCIAYEPATGRLRIANAGHLPPLVVSPGGGVRRLEVSTSLPLSGEPLHLRVRAHPETLSDVRRSLRQWLERAGATDEETHSIILASGEACANSIEHAYGPGEAELEVEARLAAGVATVSVRDFGQWRTQR